MQDFKQGDYHKYAWAIREAERRFAIPENLLAKLLCHTSEGFNNEVISGTKHKHIGVCGIAKFTPDEGRYLAIDRLDPHGAIHAAGRYLRELRDITHDWNKALLAFRWGKENFMAWHHAPAGPAPAAAREFVARVNA